MNKGIRNAILWILIGCLIVAVGVSLYHIATTIYLESIFPKEELTESYDGKYGYLQLSSPKEVVCTINLYDMQAPPGGNAYKQTLHKFYNKWDMENISWGIQSYDLFFDIPEGGPYMYKFDAEYDRWVGPLYFDESETKEKRLQGDNDSYCFESGYNTNKEEFPEYPFGESTIVEKDTIPKNYLKNLDFYLSQN